MCGFAGILALRDAKVWTRDRLQATVEAMNDAITHRGPDDRGIWLHPREQVALGHRRLSIVDLSPRGHQPMSYRDRFTIVFNGEIYNFRELRARLIDLGHVFASDTDTEVVIAAVSEWGIEDALQLMTGMFAFALWDERDRLLYLARDRLGEKPLHLAIVRGSLVFGSELRAVERAMGVDLKLDPVALSGYLQDGYVAAPRSLWAGIFKLPAASYVRFSAHDAAALRVDDILGQLVFSGGPVHRYYWSPPLSTATSIRDADALDRLDGLMRSAVALQMQCDVPMGVFLSGGIDSTVVAALTQAQNSFPISTYTIKFDAPEYDESQHAAAVAAHIGTRHHEIVIRPESLVQQVPLLSGALDEPTANASYFPLHLMAVEARRTVKVVLSGDGGDELFGGYNRYLLTPFSWNKVSRIPYALRNALAATAGKVPGAMFDVMAHRYRSSGQISGQVSSAVFVKKTLRVLRSNSLADCYEHLMRCWDDPQKIADVPAPRRGDFQCSNGTFLSDATRFDLRRYLPDDNLAKSDRATMAAGLESRVPLLDHHVVEFACGLPDELRIRAGTTKWLLRQLAYRYVPQKILDRPKMGFSVPLRKWLTGPLRQWAEDLLHSRVLHEQGLLRINAIDREWRALQHRETGLSWELWAVVMYAAWLESKFGRRSP